MTSFRGTRSLESIQLLSFLLPALGHWYKRAEPHPLAIGAMFDYYYFHFFPIFLPHQASDLLSTDLSLSHGRSRPNLGSKLVTC